MYVYWQCSCGKQKKKDGDLTLHALTHFTPHSESLLQKLIVGTLRDEPHFVGNLAKTFLGKCYETIYSTYYRQQKEILPNSKWKSMYVNSCICIVCNFYRTIRFKLAYHIKLQSIYTVINLFQMRNRWQWLNTLH